MVSQPFSLRTDRQYEKIVALDLFEQILPIPFTQNRMAQIDVEFFEHRCLKQKLAQIRGLHGKDLLVQVNRQIYTSGTNYTLTVRFVGSSQMVRYALDHIWR